MSGWAVSCRVELPVDMKAMLPLPASARAPCATGRLGAKVASSAATIDALVGATALAAQARPDAARCVVLTSDPADLGALLADHPEVRVIAVPRSKPLPGASGAGRRLTDQTSHGASASSRQRRPPSTKCARLANTGARPTGCETPALIWWR
jgi:hypothetical protein